jgi:hypothetical protein
MKRSRLWLMLTLTASGLLLTAANPNLSSKPSPGGVKPDSKCGQSYYARSNNKSQPQLVPDDHITHAYAIASQTNNKQSSTSKDSSGPNSSRYSDLLLVLFTGCLVVVGALQLCLLGWNFYITYVPNVQIRHIRPLSDLGDANAFKTVSFEFETEIVNRGKSIAQKISSNIELCLDRTEYPLLKIRPEICRDFISGKLKPGSDKTYIFRIDPQKYGLSVLRGYMDRNTGMSLYILGSVKYQDRLCRPYKMGFLRRLIIADRPLGIQEAADRFVIVNDPNYEYAD